MGTGNRGNRRLTCITGVLLVYHYGQQPIVIPPRLSTAYLGCFCRPLTVAVVIYKSFRCRFKLQADITATTFISHLHVSLLQIDVCTLLCRQNSFFVHMPWYPEEPEDLRGQCLDTRPPPYGILLGTAVLTPLSSICGGKSMLSSYVQIGASGNEKSA